MDQLSTDTLLFSYVSNFLVNQTLKTFYDYLQSCNNVLGFALLHTQLSNTVFYSVTDSFL